MTLRLEKLPLKILLSSVLLIGVLKAEDNSAVRPTRTPRSENSYLNYKESKTGFCGESSSSAENLIKNLAEKNQNSFDRIESIKEKINSDIAAITILQETQRAKTEYLAKISEMSDKSGKQSIQQSIQNSKDLFSKAMFLSSLSAILSDKSAANTTESLKVRVCNNKKLMQTSLCAFFPVLFPTTKDEKSYDFLKLALTKISSAKVDTVKQRSLDILNSIPKDFSPDIMIALFDSRPELKLALSDSAGDSLLKCINNSSNHECVNFFGDNGQSKKVIDAVLAQNAQIGQHLQLRTEDIDNIVAQDKIELEKNHKILTAVKDDSVIDLKNLTDKCIADINARLDKGPSAHREKLSNFCKVSDKDQFQHEAQSNIVSLSKELNSIRANENFNTVESFKSYLANKYLCMCPQARKIKIDTTTSCHRLDGVDAPSTIYSLGGTVSDIIRNINYADKISNECQPSEQKIRELNERCNKVANQSDFKSVCIIVSGENEKQQKTIADDKAWKSANEKFWIKRDPSAKGGYTKTPKKTTMELLGEGMAPAIPTLVPMWFANYQMSNHIDMLTQQAMAEKQYYHTIGMYNQNPWMYGMPYFQGNYLPIGTFGATGAGTTTNTGAGFNFSSP